MLMQRQRERVFYERATVGQSSIWSTPAPGEGRLEMKSVGAKRRFDLKLAQTGDRRVAIDLRIERDDVCLVGVQPTDGGALRGDASDACQLLGQLLRQLAAASDILHVAGHLNQPERRVDVTHA